LITLEPDHRRLLATKAAADRETPETNSERWTAAPWRTPQAAPLRHPHRYTAAEAEQQRAVGAANPPRAALCRCRGQDLKQTESEGSTRRGSGACPFHSRPL